MPGIPKDYHFPDGFDNVVSSLEKLRGSSGGEGTKVVDILIEVAQSMQIYAKACMPEGIAMTVGGLLLNVPPNLRRALIRSFLDTIAEIMEWGVEQWGENEEEEDTCGTEEA